MLSKAVERGVLFVITGPSGVGKSTLIEYVREHIPELILCICNDPSASTWRSGWRGLSFSG